MWLPIHKELLEMHQSDMYKLYIDSHYSDNLYHPENAREIFRRKTVQTRKDSLSEVQDGTNFSSVTFDHEESRNAERSSDANTNSVSGIKCVVTKKTTSIEEISSKTVSNRNQIGNKRNEVRQVTKRKRIEEEEIKVFRPEKTF